MIVIPIVIKNHHHLPHRKKSIRISWVGETVIKQVKFINFTLAAAETTEEDMMAMMGFGGFGGSAKE